MQADKQWMTSRWNLPERSLLLLLLVISTYTARAQNLESIGKEKPVTVSGGVQLNTTGYAVKGINARRPPFTWIGTGNLNIDLYGWSIPLAFSYTNNQGSFQQPFNRYGITPKYKWGKAYMGYHSLTYSAYTLNGHMFLGGGLELTPGNYRVSMMYGRLQKAVAADTIAEVVKPPAYQRYGSALKVGYGTANGSVDAIIFYAADDINSLTYVPVNLSVFPAQNVALSLIAKKQFGKRLSADAEWATSLFTRDRTAAQISKQSNTNIRGPKLIPVRESTVEHHAFKGGLTVALNKGYLQGMYERIDPDYQTLGSYFFNNDLENITLGIGWQFWKDRLQLNAQGGIQHNNLDQSEISQTRRWVSNYTANLRPNDRWQFTTTYSNFTSYTNVRPQLDPFFSTEFDSLNFYQINQNATLVSSYAFGNKERKGNIIVSSTYQQANEATRDSLISEQVSYYYSNNASYRIAYVPLNLALSVGGNLHHSILGFISTTTWGPMVSANKSLMEKKIRGTLATGFNQVVINQVAGNRVMTARFSTNYSPAKSHQLSLNINFLNSFPVEQQTGFSEWTATARYGYTF